MEIEVSTEEIAEYMFEELVKRGYNITEDEADEIADIVFEWLIHKGIMEEEK
jgi:hypothetical protein